VHLHLTVYRKVVKSIDTAICELDSLKFGNRWIKKDSTYIDNLHTWKGCDSIVTLRLHVNRLPRDTIRETICEGSVRIFGGARLDTFYTSGTYRDTIHRSTRCDSLVMLILKVNGRGRLTLLNRRCEGDTIKFVRLTDTLYLHKDTTLFTMQFRGCDSIFHRYEFVPKPSLTKDLVVEPRCLYSQTGRISLSLNRKRQDLQWEWLKGDTLFPRPTDVVWTADSQSLVISRLDTGRYLMRIMDNQICKDTLRLPILLEYQKFRIDSTKACKGLANGTARFVYNTKPNYSYKWQVNQPYSRIETIMVHLRAGRYVVTVWDDYTGKLCDSVRFQIPEVDTSVNYRQYTICYGDTLRAHDTIFTTKHQGHRMTVKRHDGLECDSIIFVTVNMRVSDQHLHLNASPRDTTIFLGDNATLKIEPNFKPIGIDWDPNKEVSCPSCPSLVTSPVREQWYSIKAQNDRKCWMSDSILVRVKRDLYTIPNAFYPTADDPLYTIYPDKAISKILKLTIFDRWGKHLYQIEKPLHGTKWGWDGKVDGMDMPQDVYRAIVEIELKDKTIEVKNQAFTLFR
jgi:gliding motility-associated-like protein